MANRVVRRGLAVAISIASVAATAAPAQAAGWVVTASPNPTGATIAELVQVSCPSATWCMAVGLAGSLSGPPKPFAERFNGTTWSVVAMPKPAGASLTIVSDVACSSPTSCFAVGFSFGTTSETAYLARWNGSTWALQSAPAVAGASTVELDGVTCVSATRCIAVGDAGAANTKSYVIVWNGQTWARATTPTPAGAALTQLDSIACPTTTACFAVGSWANGSFTSKTLIERWSAAGWTIQPSPNPLGSAQPALASVACTTATSCFATGSAFTGPSTAKTLIERWNGSVWTMQPSPNAPGTAFDVLGGVSCVDATHCWAMGEAGASSAATKTLVERWNGTAWSVQSSPNPSGATASFLADVQCVTITHCVAVGGAMSTSSAKTLVETGP